MFGLNGNTKTVNENYKTAGKPIVKLKECTGKTLRIWGYLITKDAGFGEGVLLCGDSEMISLPKRYLEGFKNSSEEDKRAVVTGDIKIYNIHEIDTNKGKTTVFDMGNNDEYMAFLEKQNENK